MESAERRRRRVRIEVPIVFECFVSLKRGHKEHITRFGRENERQVIYAGGDDQAVELSSLISCLGIPPGYSRRSHVRCLRLSAVVSEVLQNNVN